MLYSSLVRVLIAALLLSFGQAFADDPVQKGPTQSGPAQTPPFGAQEPSKAKLRIKFQGLYDNATELPTYKFLQRAKKTIDIEIYEMADPEFRRVLRAKLTDQNPVRIRVVKEPKALGDICPYFGPLDETKFSKKTQLDDCIDQRKLVDEVKSAGGSFVPFNKEQLCGIKGKNCYEHGKMIIVDGRYALLSTGNFNSSSLCNAKANPEKCNRDYSYVTADRTIVRALKQVFENDLNERSYDLKAILSPEVSNKITVSPYSSEPLAAFIRSAKVSVRVENQYLKEKEINAALIEVAKKGVKVFVQVSSLCSYGKPSLTDALRLSEQFHPFDTAGIQTRMFTSKIKVGGRPGYLHAKTIIVDGKRAWMGSVNGSSTSTSQNREYGIFFASASMVSHLRKIMKDDFEHPMAVTWQESLACKNEGAVTPDGHETDGSIAAPVTIDN